jgi:hypothetical protein
MNKTLLKRVIKKELSDIKYDRKKKIAICLIIFIPILDVIIGMISHYGRFFTEFESYGTKDGILNLLEMAHRPKYSYFLTGKTQGHIAQILLIWLLPIYMLLACGDKKVGEEKVGYSMLLSTRTSVKIIFKGKLINGFIVGFSTVFISMIINCVLCHIVFFKGKEDGNIENLAQYMGSIFKATVNHPYLVYLIYILLFSVLAGLCMVMCISISYIFKDYKILYGISIGIWLYNIMHKYTLVNIVQPYIEYGFKYMAISFTIFLSMVIVSVVAGYFVGIRREVIQ